MRVEAATGADRADMIEFVKWQMQIGNGLDEAGLPSDSVEIPLHMISPTQDDLIETIFPDPDNLAMTALSSQRKTSTATL